MNRNDKTRVTIEIYDADGDLRESLGGEYTFLQIRSLMKEILANDGIPVIRQLGKHAKVGEPLEGTRKPEQMPFFAKALTDALEAWGKPQEIVHGEKTGPFTIPMVLEYKFDGIEFRAAGHPLDVHAANNALLKRVFEEES